MNIAAIKSLAASNTVLINRIKRFLIAGAAAASVNIAIMVFFVEALRFNTYLLKNIANLLSIEVSVLFNFIVSSCWTWKDAPTKAGKALAAQCLSFHLAAGTGIALRSVLFALLDLLGVFYVINIVFGIGVAAGISFLLYDRIVFKRPGKTEAESYEASEEYSCR